MHWYRLGAGLLESTSTAKVLEVLVDRELFMEQQCAMVTRKTNGTLGNVVYSSWLPSSRVTGNYWMEVSGEL